MKEYIIVYDMIQVHMSSSPSPSPIRYIGKVRQMGDKLYITVPAENRNKVIKLLDKDVKVALEDAWSN